MIPLDDFNYSFAQLTLLQQMALGVAILAADVPSIRDYANLSNGIILYKPYNIEDLKEKLVQLSNYSVEDSLMMKKSNIEAIKTSLSEMKMAHEFEEICNKLVNQET